MTSAEEAVLESALDALDRLFDRESQVIDVYALFFSSAVAMKGTKFERMFAESALRLHGLIAAGTDKEAEREMALEFTDELRKALADALPNPSNQTP